MAKKKKQITKMQCQECKEVNYFTSKTKAVEERLELKKFCKNCKKHTVHKEAKK